MKYSFSSNIILWLITFIIFPSKFDEFFSNNLDFLINFIRKFFSDEKINFLNLYQKNNREIRNWMK